MQTSLKAGLEKVINQWIDKQCEEGKTPDGLIPPSLAEEMTKAAAIVWDISFDSSQFTKLEA